MACIELQKVYLDHQIERDCDSRVVVPYNIKCNEGQTKNIVIGNKIKPYTDGVHMFVQKIHYNTLLADLMLDYAYIFRSYFM